MSRSYDDASAVDTADVLEYRDLMAWVEDWLSSTVRRYLRSTDRWCERWWAHPEAAARLGAMWAAWEVANAEGGASLSQWWLSHFDNHWPALIDSHGPFAGCRKDECRHADRLPVASVPPDVRRLIG